MIAKLATDENYFALAQNRRPTHIAGAFQASSPKTSMARPATVGPFFLARLIFSDPAALPVCNRLRQFLACGHRKSGKDRYG
jgi:hypothetical protein